MRCSFVREMFPLLVNACFHFTRGALIATKDIQQFPPNLSLAGPAEGTHTYTHIHRLHKAVKDPHRAALSVRYVQLLYSAD